MSSIVLEIYYLYTKYTMYREIFPWMSVAVFSLRASFKSQEIPTEHSGAIARILQSCKTNWDYNI